MPSSSLYFLSAVYKWEAVEHIQTSYLCIITLFDPVLVSGI